MDKMKIKHYALLALGVIVVCVPTIYVYNLVATHVNTAATTAPATTTATA